ncbi:HtaA domain-containing protein [Streptomyces sp. NPDC053048]|uniref:HtaA domain-containing protein n=1 Tax=Streptomyces sp. NPDC053048 TaxID=3365694 RepID=UPI0037D910A8
MPPFRPARAPVAALFGALAGALPAALLVALLPAGVSHAAESREVSGGRLDWGIKSSFQSYVTGPVAQGRWELRDGAATVGGSQFRFHSAKGSYRPGSGAFEAAFSGGVHFTGHRKADGSNELDLTVSRPAVRLSGRDGTLYVDVVSKAKGTGEVTTATHVPFASLDLSGIDLRGAGTAVTLANVPATLTARGATAFAGYYTEGTALDRLSLSADVLAAAATSSPSASPSATPEEKDRHKGEFTGAAVDWGVRRTFREYVTGSIAQGSWKLTDGAQDGGALFRFPAGKGTYDADTGRLDAAFAGTVRFTGKDLDLALSRVVVAAKDGRGTLSADVTRGGGQAERTEKTEKTEKNVPLVSFDTSGLKEKDGLAAVSQAPAKLTAEGAKAFGGMYQEGAEMDPVSLAVPLDGKAQLPALPNLGSAPKAAPAASVSASAPAAAVEEEASSSFPVLPVAIGAGVLVAAGAAGYLVVRKRRATNGT